MVDDYRQQTKRRPWRDQTVPKGKKGAAGGKVGLQRRSKQPRGSGQQGFEGRRAGSWKAGGYEATVVAVMEPA